MRKQLFNKGWKFGLSAGSAFDSLFGVGAQLQAVDLPHDASIGRPRNPGEPNGSGNGFFREECYSYIKEFELPADQAGSIVYLEFEGVYQNAFVYINGAFAGKHPYGYGNFYIDVTPYVNWGQKNQLQVNVKNGVPSGRWYTGGGIFRDVNLLIGDHLHLVPDQVHLATVDLEEDLAVIRVDSAIDNASCQVRDLSLQIQLLDADQNVAAEDTMKITMLPRTRQTYRQQIYVTAPRLWSIDRPYLYQYRAIIRENGQITDESAGSFGIRSLQLDTKYGLRINGEAIKLRGGCLHHDNGVIGTAEFAHAEEFRVKTMKEAGYNSLRSSHYPMSRQLLEACDKYGMVVMDEFADVWTSTKVAFDYGIHMSDWWELDVENLVNKDYNHPCVIFYSIGNEIPETGNKFDVQWGKKLADKFRALDDSRFVTDSLNIMLSVMSKMDQILPAILAGQGIDPSAMAAADGSTEINSLMTNMADMMNTVVGSDVVGDYVEEAAGQVDAIGYNYAACRYEPDLEKYPNRILIGSETYPADLDVNWELVEKHPRILGDYSWTAWDYLGEAGIGKISYDVENQGFGFYASYPCKAAYCGDMNLLGDRRPISYWREIIWGLRKAPYLCAQLPQHYGQKWSMSGWCMTDAVRSWTWTGFEGKPIIVEAYTDAKEAALYVNGRLLEKKKVGEKKKAQVFFDTIYEPGLLELVVYSDGQEVGRDSLATAGEESRICMKADCESIPADGTDICYVELEITDEKSIRKTGAVTPVTISIEGSGEILGFGSADPESEENYFDRTAVPYEGRLRAAIRATGIGTIQVTAAAEGMETVSIEIAAK